jgi:hypothetical protein
MVIVIAMSENEHLKMWKWSQMDSLIGYGPHFMKQRSLVSLNFPPPSLV